MATWTAVATFTNVDSDDLGFLVDGAPDADEAAARVFSHLILDLGYSVSDIAEIDANPATEENLQAALTKLVW